MFVCKQILNEKVKRGGRLGIHTLAPVSFGLFRHTLCCSRRSPLLKAGALVEDALRNLQRRLHHNIPRHRSVR